MQLKKMARKFRPQWNPNYYLAISVVQCTHWILWKCQSLIFKVNFVHQKSSKIFWFFSLKYLNLGANFFLLEFIDNVNFWIILFLKLCPIFDSLPLLQFSQFNNFLWLQLISNFASLRWKPNNWYSNIGKGVDETHQCVESALPTSQQWAYQGICMQV